jgi:hypothetical protein
MPTASGRSLAILLLLLGPSFATPASAQEFIIHANGDSINGDVKGFERGKLKFEIPGGSATLIEFDKLTAIGSSDFWDIELDDLTRAFGSLAPGTEPGTVRILGDAQTREVPLASIVKMTSIDAGFWSKFDGFLEFGFSYGKANNITNYTLAASVDYRGTKWASGFTFDSRLNSQDSVETTKRNQLSLNITRLLPKTWSVGAFTQLEQNQELDLDLRLLLGAFGGRDILQSNKVEWRWAVGLLGNREGYTGLERPLSTSSRSGTGRTTSGRACWCTRASASPAAFARTSTSSTGRTCSATST